MTTLDARPMTDTTTEVLLEAEGLKKYFPVTKGLLISKTTGYIKAVDGVSFQIRAGETLGIVGESGCGKSTTAKMLLQLEDPTEGTIRYQGREIHSATAVEATGVSKFSPGRIPGPVEFVEPQDAGPRPDRRTHGHQSEPQPAGDAGPRLQTAGRRRAEQLSRQPVPPTNSAAEQRQRLAIARALSVEPRVIVLDEPVSALDVSIRAQIMNLLKDLQQEYNVSYLLIAHHLATVRYMCDWVAVMYLGQIVEFGPTRELFDNASHPYTKALMNAALPSHPDIEQEEMILTGEVPSPLNPPEGCRFHPRCPFVIDQCSTIVPGVRELAPGHRVSCHLY